MRYVLDSNVALKWVLNEPDSPKAVRIRDGFTQGIHELRAPDVLPVEVGHAQARAERRGVILPPDAAVNMNCLKTVQANGRRIKKIPEGDIFLALLIQTDSNLG